MLKVGQLRRWIWRNSPLPESWEGRVFLIVEEKPRWIDKSGKQHSSWSFMIDGIFEPDWRGEDIERMSEAIDEDTP